MVVTENLEFDVTLRSGGVHDAGIALLAPLGAMQGQAPPRLTCRREGMILLRGRFLLPLAFCVFVLALTGLVVFQVKPPPMLRVVPFQVSSRESNLYFSAIPMPIDEREGLIFSSMPLEESNEVLQRWLENNSPIFAQPEHDARLGHALVKVFYTFRREVDSREIVCQLIIVYEGEGSYRLNNPLKLNTIATFFYMSYNRIVYGRTADVDYLTIYGVDLNPPEGAPAWKSIRSIDGSGNQTFSQGNKGNLFKWLSLFYHYRFDILREEWEVEETSTSKRPVVYVNTADHLMGHTNANPQLEMRRWRNYTLEHGGRDIAEVFARTHVCQKPVLWNPWPNCARRCAIKLKASRKEALC